MLGRGSDIVSYFFENWLFILGPLAVFVVTSIYLRIKKDELKFAEFDRPKPYVVSRSTLECIWCFSDGRLRGKIGENEGD